MWTVQTIKNGRVYVVPALMQRKTAIEIRDKLLRITPQHWYIQQQSSQSGMFGNVPTFVGDGGSSAP